jgi:hypothetical protein
MWWDGNDFRHGGMKLVTSRRLTDPSMSARASKKSGEVPSTSSIITLLGVDSRVTSCQQHQTVRRD